MFASVEEIQERFHASRYIASRRIATVVFLATRMQRPILVEGPAGVGKTELAKVLAQAVGRPLMRLQCYEGLDEAKALYEWKYAKQLLYTQILRDRIGELTADAPTLAEAVDRVARQEDAFFSSRFLSPRPLLGAILAEDPVVLLVDEIDKAEVEFEAFLLEVLSDWQVSVPELGTIRARHVPLVVLTSNNARELTDGLKRRCLHLFIDFPVAAEELAIIRLKVPEIGEKLARQVVSRGAEDPGSGAAEEPLHLREPGLGPGPGDPQRRPPGPRPGGVDPDAPGQARAGPRAGQGQPGKGTRRVGRLGAEPIQWTPGSWSSSATSGGPRSGCRSPRPWTP